MPIARVWTDEDKKYLDDNYTYDPCTGLVWYKKQNPKGVRTRNMDAPLKSLRNKNAKTTYYCLYTRSGTKRKIYSLHRVVWYLHYQTDPPNLIDHIDRDPLNNKIENLRETTYSLNQRNSNHKSRGSGGCRGVSKQLDTYRTKPWLAQLNLKGRESIYIGSFATKMEAARAYDIALVAKFGAEYVVTNKDEGVYTDEH